MSYFWSGGNLKKGSQGTDVSEWQKFLAEQGYYTGSIDGSFGDLTHKATIDYQNANGLTADGIAGIKTLGNAGFKNYNYAVDAPTINPLPTRGTYDSTSWDETTKGKDAWDAYINLQQDVSEFGPFTFSEADWAKNVDESIKNYGKFSYDFNEDALYQQYKDKYIKQAKMASADVMGQAAAMNGGYGSSYAQTVGNQAYQAQLENLNDVIPELYQMALERYNMGKQDLYSQADYLMQKHGQEYGEYSDKYSKLLDELGMAQSNYYDGADMFYKGQTNKNDVVSKEFADDMAIWEAETGQAWEQAAWDEEARRRAEDKALEQQNASGKDNNGGKKDDEPIDDPYEDKNTYADWDYGDWEAYFAHIRQTEGQAAAEEELKYFTSKGLIPTKFTSAGASGARGGKLGH